MNQRVKKLRALLKRTGLPGVFISSPTNVTYLTGFTGDASLFIVTPEKAVLVSDARFTQQIEEECDGIEVAIRGSTGATIDLAGKIIRKLKVDSLGVEAGDMTLSMYEQLSERVGRTELVPIHGMVEKLRLIKDKSEIIAIRRAIRIAEKAIRAVVATMTLDRTEKQVSAELEYQIRCFGGKGCSFEPIVGVGPRGALPHAPPTDRQVGESDFVLIDWGANESLYISDLTRIFVTGRISPKLERVYGVVLNAQRRAIERIRPGVRMGKVDEAARSVIEKAGFGKKFTHATGHGIGLQVHEAPRIGADQAQTLQAGMVVTVEPGIYLPGWGGVRIEDDILVTRDGHEVLSSVSKELSDCQVG